MIFNIKVYIPILCFIKNSQTFILITIIIIIIKDCQLSILYYIVNGNGQWMYIWRRAGNHWFVSNFGWTHALARGIMFHWKLQRKPSIAVPRSKQISFRFILSWQIFTNSLNKLGQLATEIFWLTPDLYLGTTINVVNFSSVDCWRNVWTNTLTIIKNKVRLMPISFPST